MTEGIRAIARFDVKPGKEDEFERRFAAAGVLEAARRVGMLGAVLLRPQSGGTFVVVSAWPSNAAYDHWRESSVATGFREAFASLLSGGGDPITYVVADEV